ncbi:hypothetical protein FACS1894219_00520 [Clostridia bacterium]|nr:hypothetical protein FACS1894219_00520 [Clostridia bacterium]
MSVRITNSMMVRRYGRALNINMGMLDSIHQQVASGRLFQKGSENPSSALKALQVRRNLSELDQYSVNIDAVDSWLLQTETALNAVKRNIDEAVLLIVQGRNDVLAPEDREIIASNLLTIQDTMLKDLNTQIAGKYLLGGANTKTPPFTVDPDTGHLLYNNTDVFEAESLDDFPDDDPLVDLGLGFYGNDDGDPEDKTTVFNMFTRGINIIGIGPNNMFNLMGRLAQAFAENKMEDVDGPIEEGDYSDTIVNVAIDGTIEEIPNPYPDYQGAFDGVAGLFKRMQDGQQHTLVELVKIGEKTNFITYLKGRTDDNIFLAESRQSQLEDIDAEEAIMNFEMQNYVYKACLQMGTYIFQPSLMDYLRK